MRERRRHLFALGARKRLSGDACTGVPVVRLSLISQWAWGLVFTVFSIELGSPRRAEILKTSVQQVERETQQEVDLRLIFGVAAVHVDAL